MSHSRGAKVSEPTKSVSRGVKRGKPEGYIPAPPLSPGNLLRKYIVSELGVTQEHLAAAMQVSRFSINQIVNGRRAVTAEMALRLAYVTSTTPDLWLNLQRDIDLYEARLNLADRLSELKVLRKPKGERELFADLE
jgi:addiction module HigA family antidote